MVSQRGGNASKIFSYLVISNIYHFLFQNKFSICFVLAVCAYRILALPVVTIPNDAEQQSGNFEGDMILSKELRQALSGQRNGLTDVRYRWPNNTVHYRIIADNFSKCTVMNVHVHIL